MAAYVEQSEVVGPFADLKREDMTAVIPAIISEAQRVVEGDIGGIVDIDKLGQLVNVPGIVWVLTQAKARELAFVAHYGGSIPEDGGQVTHWADIYKNGLAMLKAGEYDAQLADVLLPRARYGTVEAI